MSMTDPIADLLTRIRNAIIAGHAHTVVPTSRLKAEICRVLREEGYLEDFAIEEEPAPGRIRITLKYTTDRLSVIQGLERVSKPSLRVYANSDDIRPVRSGLGVSILSTSHGVMTGQAARKAGIGGEVLCNVW